MINLYIAFLRHFPSDTMTIKRTYLLLLISFIPLFGLKANHINIPFYTEQLELEYNPAILLSTNVSYNDQSIVAYFREMEKTPFQSILNSLEKHRDQYQLNDWFYYELLRKSIHTLFRAKPDLQKTLTCWFLLSKAGFDTRLTYIDNQAFVYVYSKDGVFEVPMIEERGKNYINLTSIHLGNPSFSEAVYLLNYVANSAGRSFNFNLQQYPSFPPKLQSKKVRFSDGVKNYALDIEVDMNVVALMKRYPVIDEKKYFEVPLSNTISNTLLPKLKKIIAGKSQEEALQLLVSFTRSAFNYKEDQDFFGKSKPMVADEVFYYPYSDCEDRSALFYCLVKDLLDLPMLIIAYPDHLTIAVATDKAIGKPIQFQGKKYYICDPTGPYNSTEIGEAPQEYAKSAFEILGFYN